VDQVSLVDTNGMLLNRPRKSMPGDGSDGNEAALEYRKTVEKDTRTRLPRPSIRCSDRSTFAPEFPPKSI